MPRLSLQHFCHLPSAQCPANLWVLNMVGKRQPLRLCLWWVGGVCPSPALLALPPQHPEAPALSCAAKNLARVGRNVGGSGMLHSGASTDVPASPARGLGGGWGITRPCLEWGAGSRATMGRQGPACLLNEAHVETSPFGTGPPDRSCFPCRVLQCPLVHT